MRYLGVDLSSVSTGIAVIDREPDGELNLVFNTIISTNPKHYSGKRLVDFAEAYQWILDEYKPDFITKETTIARMGTQHILLKFAGVLEMVSCNMGYQKVYEYAPTTIKKEVTGDGKASKEKLAEALLSYVDFNKEELIGDETDAIGVVLTHLSKTSTLLTKEAIAEARDADKAIERALSNVEGGVK